MRLGSAGQADCGRLRLGRRLRPYINTTDVSSRPTDAELDAAFGAPAEVGAGFIRLINDNAAGADFYLVASDGSNWWILTATKAA